MGLQVIDLDEVVGVRKLLPESREGHRDDEDLSTRKGMCLCIGKKSCSHALSSGSDEPVSSLCAFLLSLPLTLRSLPALQKSSQEPCSAPSGVGGFLRCAIGR